MMKFRHDEDAQVFLAEVGIFENLLQVKKDYVPTKEQLETFIKSREGHRTKPKDKDKSSAQKKNWRKNKGKIKRGIKAFHKSVEGKKFHRNLGRFLATRITRDKTNSKDEKYSLIENMEYIKALNSAKQHLFIELDYFHAITEQAQLEELVIDYALPFFRDIENKVIFNDELNIDEIDFLVEMTGKDDLILEVSNSNNVPVEKMQKVWNPIIVELFKKDNYTLEQFTEDFAKEVRKLK